MMDDVSSRPNWSFNKLDLWLNPHSTPMQSILPDQPIRTATTTPKPQPTPQVIGVGATVLGDMSSRPNWGLNELDFVFATLVVGSVINFSLMYLLAPTAGAAAAAGGGSIVQRLLSDEFLKKWGAPGGCGRGEEGEWG